MSCWKLYPWAFLITVFLVQEKIYSQCAPSQSELTLTIDFTLDNYPDEDAWKLIDLTTGLTVDSSCFGDYSTGGMVSETFCVNPGDDYTLLVLDDYGDGLDGATYSLGYAYGKMLGSVSNTNLGIPYPHCGATYSNNVIVDSITFKAAFNPAPPCQSPSQLWARSWSSNSATIGWTENDSAQLWQIEYGATGFNPGAGNQLISNTNPGILGGLADDSEYDFYVRAICSPGDTSGWAGPFYFKSSCGPISSFPYQENFDDTISCWRAAVKSGTSSWRLATGTGSDINSAFEGVGFMEKDFANSESILISPPFDLNSLTTNGQIKLYLHRHDLADPNDEYVVLVNDTPKIARADTLLQIFSKTSIPPVVPTKGWYEYFADIPSSYQNQTVYIIIKGTTEKDIFSYDLGVDLFSLRETPTCPSPSNFSAIDISDSSIALSWMENAGANTWELEIGIKGFTKGSGSRIMVNSNPYTLNNLMANTNYDIYLRAICSANDSSLWAGPFTFSTECSAVTTLPFTENFDGIASGASDWNCWKVINVDGAESWRQGNQYLNYTLSGQYAALGMGNNDDHLISPKINLPNKPLILTLYDKVENSTFNNIYEILISTTGDSIKDFTDTLAKINARDTAWTKRNIYLSAYAGQEIYISIHQVYSAAEYYGFGIDNFKLDTTMVCVEPSNIALVSALDSSASLSWIENATANQWQTQYGPKSFTLGTGKLNTVNNRFIMLDSLSASTSYDFYVRSICSAGDSSLWAGPYTFESMCLPISLPYSQDFENNTHIPSCWRQGAENFENWLFEDSIMNTNHVGDLGKFHGTSISGKHFAYVDDSSPHGSSTSLLSPLFDMDNAQKPLLSFFRISNSEGQRNVDFSVEVWDGANWNLVFFSDTNSLNKDWEQIIVPLNQLNFVGDAQVRFTVEENNGKNVSDDVAIDDLFIGSANDFIPFYAIDEINNVDANGLADSMNIEAYIAGIIANTTYFPYTNQAFTLIDTSTGEQEGIFVLSPPTMGSYQPQLGDFIMVRGMIGQQNGLQIFNADSLRLEERKRGVEYRIVSDLDEKTESELVILENLLVSNIQTNQGWINIDLSNGISNFNVLIDTATQIDNHLTIQLGDELCSIKGVGMQKDSTSPYTANYYLSPTKASDFVFQPKIELGRDTTVCDTAQFILDAGQGFETYQWSTGDTSRFILVSPNDSIYSVSVTDQNGCSAVDSIKVTVDICTGIEELASKPSILVFPNPANGVVNIKLGALASDEIKIGIYDLSGKEIKSKLVNPKDRKAEWILNLDDQVKGIYFIKIGTKTQSFFHKLILQ